MDNTKNRLATLQFIGSSIKQLEINNDFVSFPMDSKKTFHVDYQEVDIARTEEKRQGIIQLNINVTIERDEQKFSLNISIEGCFVTNDIMTDEAFQSMLAINGQAILYSIARANIISISSLTFVNGSIVLPMLNFVDSYSESEN